MKRRHVLSLLGGAAASWQGIAWGQKGPKPARIGFLGLRPSSAFANRIKALWAGLHQLGYVEGKNVFETS